MPHWQSYFELCKPKVVALMLITAAVGMLLASDELIPLSTLLPSLVGIGFAASAGAVVNHLIDRRIDAIMNRTQKRPIPTGQVLPYKAAIFAAVMGIVGIAILALRVNGLTALLTAFALVGYGFIYTLYLKRATPQNIVLGGLAGAMPPLLGWTAVTNRLDYEGLLLVLIIFTWTPAHFWALALGRREEYKKAKIPMLPVTHGEAFTKRAIFLYVILTLLMTLFPFIVSMSGFIYLVGVLLLNARLLFWSVHLYRSNDPKIALKLFHYSNLYLLSVFILLLVDHYFLIRVL